MRDAFGSAFSIKLMIIFLMLYVSFICVAINYSRAFRVKNRIINIIEQHEGYDETAGSAIESYLLSTGYFITEDEVNICNGCSFYSPGYSILQKNATGTNAPKYYYVETYLVFNIPIINVSFPISISGETRRIETLN